jgi:hypothetical protein
MVYLSDITLIQKSPFSPFLQSKKVIINKNIGDFSKLI